MSTESETRCFTCGLPAGEPGRFNHLPNGLPCPTCRDRLLESLAPVRPAEPEAWPGIEGVEDLQGLEGLEGEESYDDPPSSPGPHPA